MSTEAVGVGKLICIDSTVAVGAAGNGGSMKTMVAEINRVGM